MSILKHQLANKEKVHICLNLPAIGRIGGAASTLSSTPKSGIRNVLGQKQANAVLSLQTPVPCSTCIMLQAHRPRTCLQNCAACAHQSAAEHRPCPAHTRMRTQSTLPALACPSLSGDAASCTPLFTQSVGFTLYINKICPTQWGLVAHPPASCSQKHLPPNLKWNETPCVLRVSHFWKQWVATVKTNQTPFQIHREAKEQKKNEAEMTLSITAAIRLVRIPSE